MNERAPSPKAASAPFITSAAELAAACARWSEADALAVDTEFVRTRTFFPALGLIQIAAGDDLALVDPVAIESLAPLAALLDDAGIVKVMHACSEDLEVLYHRFGFFPRPIFDTQVAAALDGRGFSLGYARLVHVLCGVELPKGQTRTNWLRRPLTAAQRRYAALDVVYLLPLFRQLQAALAARGRLTWVEEEVARLYDPDRFLPAPEEAFRRLKSARSLHGHALIALQDLCAWREEIARQRDLPRSFVISDADLLLLARKRPRSRQQLAALQGLDERTHKRYGGTLLSLLQHSVEADPATAPTIQRPTNTRPYRAELTGLRKRVSRRAAELELPPELLATQGTLSQLLQRTLRDDQPVLPPELQGWRAAIIGEALAADIAHLRGRA